MSIFSKSLVGLSSEFHTTHPGMKSYFSLTLYSNTTRPSAKDNLKSTDLGRPHTSPILCPQLIKEPAVAGSKVERS